MDQSQKRITAALKQHATVFKGLLEDLTPEMYTWRPAPGKWNLLEIVCHLYDEELEDFRARVRHTLNHPGTPPPPIDPEGWVAARGYANRNYEESLVAFLEERAKSVEWLQSLEGVNWENFFDHKEFGRMTAHFYLANWLAHDLLHIRQILSLKFAYLKAHAEVDLVYAGNW